MKQLILVLLLIGTCCRTLALDPKNDPNLPINQWDMTGLDIKTKQSFNSKLGWSYVISGGIGFAGGLAGEGIASDPIEQAAYTVFQTIGIASIGYGLYKVYIPSEEEKLYRLLEQEGSLTDLQRAKLYSVYQEQQKENLKNEKKIRALTHGLIAALNFNNASKQKQGTARDALFFIGGVNLLACISYSFDF